MNKKHITSIFCIPIASLLVTSVNAASLAGYSEGWDTAGDLAGWGPNTTVTTVVHAASGGNPGGHLQSRGIGAGTFDIGALSQLPDITGSFGSTVWTASVDLSFINGNFDDAWLRFRYLDSTENGWNFSLTNVFPADWTTFSVTFDPTWTDVQAMANGWLPDNIAIDPGANPSQTWALTMSDVYTTEVRLSGEDSLLAGIDNFRLQPVPIPAAFWLFGSGLVGLIGIARRKKS